MGITDRLRFALLASVRALRLGIADGLPSLLYSTASPHFDHFYCSNIDSH